MDGITRYTKEHGKAKYLDEKVRTDLLFTTESSIVVMAASQPYMMLCAGEWL